MPLLFRRATLSDLKSIVSLLAQDELGKERERAEEELAESYVSAFQRIKKDPNQYLLVVSHHNQLVGTSHLTLMPSLTFQGSLRLQIEAVRVLAERRGEGIGKRMIEHAIAWGESQGVSIVQLTTNKTRGEALYFYESLGFEATHEGMKLYVGEKNG